MHTFLSLIGGERRGAAPVFVFVFGFVCFANLFAQDSQRLTFYEPSGFTRTPRYAETVRSCRRLGEAMELNVTSYRFKNVRWQARPFEGRHPLQFDLEEIQETRTYPAGSAVVDMNQRAACVAHILEPQAPDSDVYWGFFDTIFEQREYAKSCVMEELAREMLAENPDLKTEFERRKKADPEFVAAPRAILNWFYRNSALLGPRDKCLSGGKNRGQASAEAFAA